MDTTEIEARLAAATPGYFSIAEKICQGRDGGEALVEFIAHAPEDIRALLDEVRRLQAQIDKRSGEARLREQIAQEIEVEMRYHDHQQIGFSAIGDAYAHAARIAREVGRK